MDTANHRNQLLRSNNNDRGPEVATRLNSNAASKRSNAAEKKLSTATEPSALCVPEKNQKVVDFNMSKSSNDDEFGFVSCSSSDSASNLYDESSLPAAISTITGKSNEYVNFSSGKSFLKIDLKSAIYSRGYLSIWVKITYRIYEKISDADWIGLYYVGEYNQVLSYGVFLSCL